MPTGPKFSTDDITDPTDWANTSLPLLQRLDNSLRCQVCKEFLNAPLITECSHTFCSLCIRRYFTEQQKCPSCRVPGQEARLRKNAGMEECLEAFLALRTQLLGLLKEKPEKGKLAEGASGGGEGERNENSNSSRRGNKSTAVRREGLRRAKNQVISYTEPAIIDLDMDGAMDDISGEETEMEQQQQYSPPPQSPPPAEELDDGLAYCPVCNNRMKADKIPFHIDSCLASNDSESNPTRSAPQPQQLPITSSFLPRTTGLTCPKPLQSTPINRTNPSIPTTSAPTTASNPPLPKLNYTLMKEKALRDKLHELGIPNHGSKAQLQARHIEWVNLFNANRDSLRPRSKRELLRELDAWERTINKGNGTTAGERRATKLPGWSDEGWAKEHGTMYNDLISQAVERSKRQRVEKDASEIGDDDEGGEGKGKVSEIKKVGDDSVESLTSVVGNVKETTHMDLSTSQELKDTTMNDTSNNISTTPLPQQSQLPHFSSLPAKPIEYNLLQPLQGRLEDDLYAFPSSQDNSQGNLYINSTSQPLYPSFHSALQTPPPPPPQATSFAQSSSSLSSYAPPVASTQVQPQMDINATIDSSIQSKPPAPAPAVRTRGMAKRTRSQMEETREGMNAGSGNESGNGRGSRSSSSSSSSSSSNISSQVFAAAAATAATGVE